MSFQQISDFCQLSRTGHNILTMHILPVYALYGCWIFNFNIVLEQYLWNGRKYQIKILDIADQLYRKHFKSIFG